MSHQSEYLSESMSGQDNGLRPLSNADDFSLGTPDNSDLSPNGFPIDDDEDDDDDDEVDEDYATVDQDDTQTISHTGSAAHPRTTAQS
ncbi:hypothetical protein PDIDSM_2450 [Penicillium digitatum]|nr:hypothetical protein PDIDSM_2450 [Penicillium digitatum]